MCCTSLRNIYYLIDELFLNQTPYGIMWACMYLTSESFVNVTGQYDHNIVSTNSHFLRLFLKIGSTLGAGYMLQRDKWSGIGALEDARTTHKC
jgi:hypothetical protein